MTKSAKRIILESQLNCNVDMEVREKDEIKGEPCAKSFSYIIIDGFKYICGSFIESKNSPEETFSQILKICEIESELYFRLRGFSHKGFYDPSESHKVIPNEHQKSLTNVKLVPKVSRCINKEKSWKLYLHKIRKLTF